MSRPFQIIITGQLPEGCSVDLVKSCLSGCVAEARAKENTVKCKQCLGSCEIAVLSGREVPGEVQP